MKDCHVLMEDLKIPLWIPTWSILYYCQRNRQVTDMIIIWSHKKVAHGGRGYTINFLRNSGFWVINANSACRSVIFKCVICWRLHGKLGVQKMADLPKERTEEAPPFTYCGLDMYGPFLIKERRTELKRYGILFTCMMVSRAVHLEVCNSMKTDSFIYTSFFFFFFFFLIRIHNCN